MIKPGRGDFTDRQILDALHAVDGTARISFRFDVLRGGVRSRSVHADGSVSLNRFADIQRTARFVFCEALDWLREEIKPYLLLRMTDKIVDGTITAQTWDARDALGNSFDIWDSFDFSFDAWDTGLIGKVTRSAQYAEFPLGVFILSTPTRTSKNAMNTWAVEAYDHTVILTEDSLTEPLLIAAGTTYLDAVQSVLVSAGISRVIVASYVSTAIPAERVFDIGTRKLEVINSLLSEINFDPIYCDADGSFILSQYTEPSAAAVGFTYRADELSIIGRDTQSDLDYFNVPNVFIAACSNPDIDTAYISKWVNDNPASKLSTVQRRRNIVSDLYRPDAIASQVDLDAYIRRIAFEANQVYEPLQFVTALNPLHGRSEVLSIRHPDATGVFIESDWMIPLSPEGQMTHNVRRLVTI